MPNTPAPSLRAHRCHWSLLGQGPPPTAPCASSSPRTPNWAPAGMLRGVPQPCSSPQRTLAAPSLCPSSAVGEGRGLDPMGAAHLGAVPCASARPPGSAAPWQTPAGTWLQGTHQEVQHVAALSFLTPSIQVAIATHLQRSPPPRLALAAHQLRGSTNPAMLAAVGTWEQGGCPQTSGEIMPKAAAQPGGAFPASALRSLDSQPCSNGKAV